MVNLYIGITDYEWFRYLSALPNVEEVNFWQPGGRTNFKALQPGELFFFKLPLLLNFIAWVVCEIKNGAASLLEMRKRIAYYRNEPDDYRHDYSIGCRILTQPFFLP